MCGCQGPPQLPRPSPCTAKPQHFRPCSSGTPSRHPRGPATQEGRFCGFLSLGVSFWGRSPDLHQPTRDPVTLGSAPFPLASNGSLTERAQWGCDSGGLAPPAPFVISLRNADPFSVSLSLSEKVGLRQGPFRGREPIAAHPQSEPTQTPRPGMEALPAVRSLPGSPLAVPRECWFRSHVTEQRRRRMQKQTALCQAPGPHPDGLT